MNRRRTPPKSPWIVILGGRFGGAYAARHFEYVKDGDAGYPVIVDADVDTVGDVAVAMELGCDGVLLNTGIASAGDPLRMAHSMLANRSGSRIWPAEFPRNCTPAPPAPWKGESLWTNVTHHEMARREDGEVWRESVSGLAKGE